MPGVKDGLAQVGAARFLAAARFEELLRAGGSLVVKSSARL
jgi:hypothetical protein